MKGKIIAIKQETKNCYTVIIDHGKLAPFYSRIQVTAEEARAYRITAECDTVLYDRGGK